MADGRRFGFRKLRRGADDFLHGRKSEKKHFGKNNVRIMHQFQCAYLASSDDFEFGIKGAWRQ
jgi:hypothetical protein